MRESFSVEVNNERENKREKERERERERESHMETHLGQKFSGSRRDKLERKKFNFYYLHLC